MFFLATILTAFGLGKTMLLVVFLLTASEDKRIATLPAF